MYLYRAVEGNTIEFVLRLPCPAGAVEYFFRKALGMIEQGHRFIKRRIRSDVGFKRCMTAGRTIACYEAMNQLRKGQVQGTRKGDMCSQNGFIARSFGLAA
jgi:transposase-like protein